MVIAGSVSVESLVVADRHQGVESVGGKDN